MKPFRALVILLITISVIFIASFAANTYVLTQAIDLLSSARDGTNVISELDGNLVTDGGTEEELVPDDFPSEDVDALSAEAGMEDGSEEYTDELPEDGVNDWSSDWSEFDSSSGDWDSDWSDTDWPDTGSDSGETAEEDWPEEPEEPLDSKEPESTPIASETDVAAGDNNLLDPDGDTVDQAELAESLIASSEESAGDLPAPVRVADNTSHVANAAVLEPSNKIAEGESDEGSTEEEQGKESEEHTETPLPEEPAQNASVENEDHLEDIEGSNGADVSGNEKDPETNSSEDSGTPGDVPSEALPQDSHPDSDMTEPAVGDAEPPAADNSEPVAEPLAADNSEPVAMPDSAAIVKLLSASIIHASDGFASCDNAFSILANAGEEQGVAFNIEGLNGFKNLAFTVSGDDGKACEIDIYVYSGASEQPVYSQSLSSSKEPQKVVLDVSAASTIEIKTKSLCDQDNRIIIANLTVTPD